MTAINRVPQNTNYLQASKYLLTFDRIGTVQYFCQSVNLPGVNLGQAPIFTPTLDIFAPDTKLTFNQLNVDFAVDEKLETWQNIYNWMRSIASPEGFEERNRLTALQNRFKQGDKSQYSDATLTVLNNLNNPTIRVQFINAFPIMLADIVFDTKLSADDIMYSTVTFQYDYYNFIPV